jgi:hypothetical protein
MSLGGGGSVFRAYSFIDEKFASFHKLMEVSTMPFAKNPIHGSLFIKSTLG